MSDNEEQADAFTQAWLEPPDAQALLEAEKLSASRAAQALCCNDAEREYQADGTWTHPRLNRFEEAFKGEPHRALLDWVALARAHSLEPASWITQPGAKRYAELQVQQLRKAQRGDAETIEQRNLRWYGRWLQLGGPRKRGAQARAIKQIMVDDGVSEATAKRGVQDGEKAHRELERSGKARPALVAVTPLSAVAAILKKSGRG